MLVQTSSAIAVIAIVLHAVLGSAKTTESRTKDHPDKKPPSWFFYGDILSHLTVYSFIREQVKKSQK